VYTSHNVNDLSTVHRCVTFDDMMIYNETGAGQETLHDIIYEDLKMCVYTGS